MNEKTNRQLRAIRANYGPASSAWAIDKDRARKIHTAAVREIEARRKKRVDTITKTN